MVDIFARRNRMPPHDVHGLALIINAERQGTPATPGDLQRALTLTSGAVTGLVDRLVRAGHVRRTGRRPATGAGSGCTATRPVAGWAASSSARWPPAPIGSWPPAAPPSSR